MQRGKACRDNARWDAAEWPSRLSARVTARERLRETCRCCLAAHDALAADLRVFAEVFPRRGGESLTPAQIEGLSIAQKNGE